MVESESKPSNLFPQRGINCGVFFSSSSSQDSVQLQSQHNLEALIWSCALGCFLLRFMTLGTKINRKYRSISVLITEQINLYLQVNIYPEDWQLTKSPKWTVFIFFFFQIEQKPHNKDELMVSNSVLKLAADLLKVNLCDLIRLISNGHKLICDKYILYAGIGIAIQNIGSQCKSISVYNR